jgi:tetratricopeptide (TPR) repeat protein
MAILPTQPIAPSPNTYSSDEAPAFSWYDVPEEVKRLLILATEQWEDTEASTDAINQAIALTGNHPDVLISAYRYFFYKNNFPLALQVANRVMDQVRDVENLPEDWAALRGILSDRQDESNIRFFLNAYVASGFILARMGEYETAKEITRRVSEINDKQFGGAAVVLDVLEHPEEEER